MRELAARLADVERLSMLHWDAGAQQFRDWVTHLPFNETSRCSSKAESALACYSVPGSQHAGKI